jgi:hypothetical protein
MVSVMPKIPDTSSKAGPSDAGAPADLSAAVRRARWLMLISAITTVVAIAAVAGVIGYRLFANNESLAGTIVNGTIFVPKDAHVVSTTISNGRVFVTLDNGGSSEVRIFDLKTLQQVGDLRFATQH